MGEEVKKFKVVFMTDKREELIIEASKWNYEGDGEISFSDENDEYIAWFSSFVAMVQII